jgi:hypothetical protein
MASEVSFRAAVVYLHPVTFFAKILNASEKFYSSGGRWAVIPPEGFRLYWEHSVPEENSGLKIALKVIAFVGVNLAAFLATKVKNTNLGMLALKSVVFALAGIMTTLLIVKVIRRRFWVFPLIEIVVPDGVAIKEDPARAEYKWNFAKEPFGDQERLVPVIYNPKTQHYERCTESFNEVLFKMVKDEGSSDRCVVEQILSHKDNSLLDEKEFLEYLAQPNQKGEHRINQLGFCRFNFIKILELAKENKVNFNVRAIDPVTHTSLLKEWAPCSVMFKDISAMDAKYFEHIERGVHLFVHALLGDPVDSGHINALRETLEQNEIPYTVADQLAWKVYQGEQSLTKEEFQKLSEDEKEIIRQVAMWHKRTLPSEEPV